MRERERERERERQRDRERERMGERDADSQRSICVEKGGVLDMVIGAMCAFISGLLSFFHLSSSIRLLTLPGLSLSLSLSLSHTHTHTHSLPSHHNFYYIKKFTL